MATHDEVIEALRFIPADDRETWVRMGMAVKSALGEDGFALWNEWSQSGSTYRERDARDVWKSLKSHGAVTVASLFAEAKANGYAIKFRQKKSSPRDNSKREAEQDRLDADERARHEAGAEKARHFWESADDCKSHPYLTEKQVAAHGLRVIRNQLLIPGRDGRGKLWSVTRVYRDGNSWVKRWLKGTTSKGLMHWIGRPTDTIILCEGYATGASLFERHDLHTVVGFSSCNLVKAATTLRECFPDKKIIVAGDLGEAGEKAALAAAKACSGKFTLPKFPEGAAGNDWNDFYNLRMAHG